MARRKMTRAKKKTAKRSRKPARVRKVVKRPARAKAKARRAKAKPRPAKAKPRRASARKRVAKPRTPVMRTPPERLARDRRVLEEEVVPTPPSSLNMDRRGSAVRTGRAEFAQQREAHATMTPSITGGDVDVNVADAYFTGDEAPGGDNPTPDQDIVDDIGKALGVQYQDNEELSTDKINERDKHRWELDPASSDDYKDRK